MNLLREYIRALLVEKKARGTKTKRTLYHINKRPARPQPKKDLLKVWDRDAVDPETGKRTGDLVPVEGTEKWERYWLKQPVKSGVFLTPNPVDIAMNHGRSGNVYAYKVPEWVIDKSGGMHRYDRGSEVLIPEDVWDEAGEEIEFLGKSMSRKELDNKTWKEQQNFGRGLTRSKAASYRSWMTDEEKAKAAERSEQGRVSRSVAGLLNTKHLEAAVKMMKADEKREVIAYLEDKLKAKPRRFERIPGERKGMAIPSIASGLDKKEEELLSLLNKSLKEAALKKYLRNLLEANEYTWDISNRKNLKLDKEALEKEDRENQEKYLKSMGLMESRFKQMFKKKFTGLKNVLQNSSFLSADPAGDGDYENWSSEAADELRDTLNDYFDSQFEPGYLTSIVKVNLLPEFAEEITKEDILKRANYKFEDGLHFIELLMVSIDDGKSIGEIAGAHEKVYEVIMHELLHMQQFLKFSKGKPTNELWNQFMKNYIEKGGAPGMGEDYFYYDEKDGASELETFSFQIATELLNALGKQKSVELINNRDISSIRKSSATLRNIESNSSIERPEFLEMLKRVKSYIKLS